MDVRANEADLSDIFAHQEWVRALALRLCGDHAAADDLVQDTWVAAMRDRDNVRSVRAWLGGIVRHRWRRDQLRSNARADREASVARDVATRSHEMPSPEGMLAQAELQRRVLAAVASLEEAARTVVLLRYYEGLSSEAIAARLGEPSSTVRNRLARAHEKLRQHLDGEYGTHAWSVMYVPAAIHHLSPIHTGIGVAMKLKLAATAVILAAGSVLLWRTMGAHEKTDIDSVPVLAQSTSVDRTVDPAADAQAPAQTSQRAPAPVSAQHRDESLLLFGAIRGPTPEQTSDSALYLIETNGSSREISVGANATYSAFGLHAGTVHLYARVRGFVPTEDEIVLSADSANVQHDVVLTPALVVPVKFVDRATKKPLLARFDVDGPRLSAIPTRNRPTRVTNSVGRVSTDGDAGYFRSRDQIGANKDLPEEADGLIEIRPPLPAWVSCVLRDTVLESRLVLGNEKEMVFEIDRAELDAALGTAKLRCVERGSGRPLEGASVSLGFRDGGQKRAVTDAQGEVTFTKLSPGLQRMEVSAAGMAPLLRTVRVLSKDPTDLGTVELAAGTSVTGRVLDANGQPIDARVTVFPVRPADSPQTVDCYYGRPCGAGGAFEIQNVERGPSRIVVQAKGYALRVLDVSTAGIQPLEIRMERGTMVRFRLAYDSDSYSRFMLADANGVPIRMEGANRVIVREEVLAPGRYQCWSLEDDRIVRRETFDVGDSDLLQEVR